MEALIRELRHFITANFLYGDESERFTFSDDDSFQELGIIDSTGILELVGASGKRGVLTFVDYGNLPSLRTHLRFGFKPATTVLAMKVLGWLMTLNIDGL